MKVASVFVCAVILFAVTCSSPIESKDQSTEHAVDEMALAQNTLLHYLTDKVGEQVAESQLTADGIATSQRRRHGFRWRRHRHRRSGRRYRHRRSRRHSRRSHRSRGSPVEWRTLRWRDIKLRGGSRITDLHHPISPNLIVELYSRG